ncbi:MAG: substrate-binding domain-containing protein [Gammaproteobacteria bacterium]
MGIKLGLVLRWQVEIEGEPVLIEPLVFTLLGGIRHGGHLNYAAREAGVSYRHAWGLLRDWEGRLGKPLVSARQGRGAHLTAFGETLLETTSAAAAQLAPALDMAALEAGARLSEAADPRRHPVTIASSHSDAVLALREHLADRHRVTLDVLGSESALHRYRRDDADIAGFHLPQGELGRTVAARLIELLDPSRDIVWLLEKRRLGLISRADAPCRALADLVDSGRRFINRQAGSGTRLAFDGLLGAAGIAPGNIRGYADEEYSHTAVAALVASGHADCAFGAEAPAMRMGLAFEALVDERFYLVVRRDADSALRRVLAEYCRARDIEGAATMKTDEFNPTVAVLKRVHRAGFWKQVGKPNGRT